MKTERSPNSPRIGRALLNALALVALLALAVPQGAFAVVAGTTITNTVEVSWTSSSGTSSTTATADVTVTFLAQPATLALQTVTPANAGQLQDVPVTYRLTTNANGSDIYTITSSSSNNNASAPTLSAVADITLGATSVLDGTWTTTVFEVPSDGSADAFVNDITANDWVVINGERRQVSSVVDDGTTAVITLLSALSAAPEAGALVAESKDFTVTVTTGLISGASPSHTLTVSATDGANPVSDNTMVINLLDASLSVTKDASAATAVPGGDITYTITVTNSAIGAASNLVLIDDLSPYVAFELGSIAFADDATTPSGLTYTPGTHDSYSDDEPMTWAYAPAGAAGTNDGAVTGLKIDFGAQTMPPDSKFVITYTVKVK